jgi:hypothetical protein
VVNRGDVRTFVGDDRLALDDRSECDHIVNAHPLVQRARPNCRPNLAVELFDQASENVVDTRVLAKFVGIREEVALERLGSGRKREPGNAVSSRDGVYEFGSVDHARCIERGCDLFSAPAFGNRHPPTGSRAARDESLHDLRDGHRASELVLADVKLAAHAGGLHLTTKGGGGANEAGALQIVADLCRACAGTDRKYNGVWIDVGWSVVRDRRGARPATERAQGDGSEPEEDSAGDKEDEDGAGDRWSRYPCRM